MNSKTIWIIIILLVVAVVITAITGHQKPIVDPQPTVDIDVTPSPEPAPSPSPSPEVTPTPEPSPEPGPEIDITPDPSPAVIIVEITEEEKSAEFRKHAQEFANHLKEEDTDNQLDIQIDSINRAFTIIYNLNDEDVRDFAIAMAQDSLLTYNDMIADMIDQATIKELKTQMYCEHLIICLKNDGQIFAAYDVIKGTECPELIENVG